MVDEDPTGGGNIYRGTTQNVIQVGTMHGSVNIQPSPVLERPHVVPQQLPPSPSPFHAHSATLRILDESMPTGPRREVISGPPGSGKSALVTHWADLRRDAFPDGRIYVNLRGYDATAPLSSIEALTYLLTSLGVPRSHLPDHPGQLAALWRSISYNLKLLIFLDDAADAAQVQPLLTEGPETFTVITSRNKLTELAFISKTRFTYLGPLSPEQAELFLRGFLQPTRGQLDSGDLAELASLCGHLQLALTVAAHRLIKAPLLTVAELNKELREQARILDPVRTVFDSVYATLSAEAGRLFRLIGLAPRSELKIGAIAALTGGTEPATGRTLSELIETNLVAAERAGSFSMHSLLHAYANELARNTAKIAEDDAAADRLGFWYAEAARSVAILTGAIPGGAASGTPTYPSPTRSREAQAWFRTEAPNFTFMLDQLVSRGLTSSAMALCTTLTELYELDVPVEAWYTIARIGLDLATAAGDPLRRAWFLESLGKAFAQTRELAPALVHHEASLELRRQCGDSLGQLRSLSSIGFVHCEAGQLDAATERLSSCLLLARDQKDSGYQGIALMGTGRAALYRGRLLQGAGRRAEFAAALTHLDAALPFLGDVRSEIRRAGAQLDRAEVLARLGRRTQASSAAAEAVGLARAHDDPLLLASALRMSASIAHASGNEREAQAALHEAAALLHAIGDTERALECATVFDLDASDSGRR